MNVQAADATNTNETLDYCVKNIPPKAKAACYYRDLDKNYITILHARNAATYECKNKEGTSFETCTTNQANKYIQKAIDKNKKVSNPQAFVNNLNDVIKASGNNPNKPAKGAGVGQGLSDDNNGAGSLFGPNTTPHKCGDVSNPDSVIHTSIDFGCVGKGNAMLDLSFAIIRFLSNGAGLIIIGSLVWAGIQYSGSRGDPQATAMAMNRVHSTIFALFIFLFAYAIINFIVPGVFLR